MSDWKRAESSTCTGEVGMPPEWLDVLVRATLPLIGLHRLPPEREAAREGCARVALGLSWSRPIVLLSRGRPLNSRDPGRVRAPDHRQKSGSGPSGLSIGSNGRCPAPACV